MNDSTLAEDRLLSEPAVRALLGGCGHTTIHRLANAGYLPRVKFGSATRFRMSDVQRLVREGVPRLPR
jgi:predicted DNA-binding transcriptional regulator AlpA